MGAGSRFTEGAKAIDNQPLVRVEAHGKNLFYFFGPAGHIVMHVHFGMSGAFKLFDLAGPTAPEPTATTRLRLEDAGAGVAAHVSAMTVDHGGLELYAARTAKLGEDPLRADADPERLWTKVSRSNIGIGALLMDQACFPGVGNIYRAEILFKAGVHPELVGKAVARDQFDRVWHHSVALLRRGFQTGSILTVDPDEAVRLGAPKLRRYVYNTAACPRCTTVVMTWDINARKVYVCPACQPMPADHQTTAAGRARALAAAPAKLFESHCAPDAIDSRRSTPGKLSVKELREALKAAGLRFTGKKAELLARLVAHDAANATSAGSTSNPDRDEVPVAANVVHRDPVVVAAPGTAGIEQIKSYAAATAEKVAAGEGLNVEHVADLDLTLAGRTVDWTDLHGQSDSRG